MQPVILKRNFLWPVLLAVLLLVSLAAGSVVQPAAAQMGPHMDGMVCTTASSPNPTFTLTTRTGYIGTPDGNVVYMWGFSEADKPFQYPSPALCVNQDDHVTIILRNTLPQDVSLIFPGQENVLADGIPSQPQNLEIFFPFHLYFPMVQTIGTSPAIPPEVSQSVLPSLAQAAPANGGSVTYSFVATHPGTFIYESGTNPAVQIRMGLFGALVVRPTDGHYFVYNDSGQAVTSEFNHAEGGEVMILQSEIDPTLNQAVERGQPFNLNNYTPRYWLYNGRGFPDTLAPNFASWLPTQPYGALAHIQPNDDMMNPLYYLERILNVSTQPLNFHPHGKNGVVIGQDGQPMRGSLGEDLSFERFSLTAGPGQTYEALFHYHYREGYNSMTNPIPVTDPGWQNLTYGMFYSGSPYLGEMGPMPPGMSTMNECGEYYIIAHNHSLFRLTSLGVPMTGPGTYLRIDPPGGCSPMPMP